MSTPTVDQLLNLADRAHKGLQPDEVKRLREGLHHLANQARQLAETQPYRVPCDHCGAAVGQHCRAVGSYMPPRTPHTARLNAAQQQPEEPMTYLRGTALEAAANTAHQRYQAGESMRAIAADTGRSYGYVRKLLILAGATIRPRGNPHWKETPVNPPANWIP